MKIWIKYIAGVLIGLAFAFVAPAQNPSFTSLMEFLSGLVIQFGRYALYPVLFFGFTVGVYELREGKTLFRLGLVTAIVIIITSLIAVVTGLSTVLIRNPSRIPIFVEGASEIGRIGIGESLRQLFPSSAFEAFTNGLFICPCASSVASRARAAPSTRAPPRRPSPSSIPSLACPTPSCAFSWT
jgi:Na+/H+-dicarboxylate symporter